MEELIRLPGYDLIVSSEHVCCDPDHYGQIVEALMRVQLMPFGEEVPPEVLGQANQIVVNQIRNAFGLTLEHSHVEED